MKYLLIFWSLTGGIHPSTAVFNTGEACVYAKIKLGEFEGNGDFRAFCTPLSGTGKELDDAFNKFEGPPGPPPGN